MDFKYLKNEQYYLDRYDLGTIKECLDYYSSIKKGFEKNRTSPEFTKYSQEKFDRETQKVLNLMVNVIKGERYKNKAKTVQEWVDRDTKTQEILDSAVAPKAIVCNSCGFPTKLTSRDLLNAYEENPQVLFMFRCTKCNKGQAFYEDGSEWVYDPPTCPKCDSDLNSKLKNVKEVLTTTYKCSKCTYIHKDVFDFKKSKEDRQKQEAKDKKLLSDYRDMFCLNDKDGQEYLELSEAMKVGQEVYEEELKKYDSPALRKAVQLKSTSINELENLLSSRLEKSSFIKLAFDKPEMGKNVIVPFTAQDNDSKRNKNESTSELKKIIKDALESTNWRLMSEGVDYRLGFLTGRLKGYENQDEMLEIVGVANPKLTPQVKSELRSKYEHHNVVQLARLHAEIKGRDKMRKRRLVNEPDGFNLEGDGVYTCPICGNTMSGSTSWYDKWGMKCINCKRNIEAGVISPEINDYETKGETWLTKWHIEDKTGLHSATIKKMIRTGELKSRQLKDEAGSVYCDIFMVDEVKDFLDKYKKIESKK